MRECEVKLGTEIVDKYATLFSVRITQPEIQRVGLKKAF